MYLDVQELRDFYYRTPLGLTVRSSLRSRIHSLWPNTRAQSVVGFGFAAPVLRPFLNDSRRVIALMPGPQGVMPWPAGLPNHSVLTDELNWPLETGHVDRLIVLHGLEHSDRADALLDECWRVLGPGGKALFIVPNRAGLWAQREITPFGFGRPYTVGQLEARLIRHQFFPEQHLSGLYSLPSQRRVWRKTGKLFEELGSRLPGILAGGALIVEASKRVYPPKGHKIPIRRPQIAIAPPIARPVTGRSGHD